MYANCQLCKIITKVFSGVYQIVRNDAFVPSNFLGCSLCKVSWEGYKGKERQKATAKRAAVAIFSSIASGELIQPC